MSTSKHPLSGHEPDPLPNDSLKANPGIGQSPGLNRHVGLGELEGDSTVEGDVENETDANGAVNPDHRGHDHAKG